MGIMTNGVKQWVFQRTSSMGFKLYLLVTLVLAALNGVLAGWQIDGDYAKKFGIPTMLITGVSILVGIFYLFYGFTILF